MEKIINNILTILSLNGSILMIPGVNFLLVARHALINGFSTGFYCALGITTAIMLHVILAAFSVSVLLTTYPLIFSCIRYIGSAYLFYLGTQFLMAAFSKLSYSINASVTRSKRVEAIRAGFLVDFLNPVVSIFYLSLFSLLTLQLNSSFESICELSFYSVTIFMMTLAWFSIVARFFAHSTVIKIFQEKALYIQMLSGFAMYYFCLKVIFGF